MTRWRKRSSLDPGETAIDFWRGHLCAFGDRSPSELVEVLS